MLIHIGKPESDEIRVAVYTPKYKHGHQTQFVLACIRYCLEHPEVLDGWRDKAEKNNDR